MRFSFIPIHYLDSELSVSGTAVHYLIAHRNSLALLVQIGLPDTVQEGNLEGGRGISGN